jgi:hypothetical protein
VQGLQLRFQARLLAAHLVFRRAIADPHLVEGCALGREAFLTFPAARKTFLELLLAGPGFVQLGAQIARLLGLVPLTLRFADAGRLSSSNTCSKTEAQ